MISDHHYDLDIKQALPCSPGNDAQLAGIDQQGVALSLAPAHRRHHHHHHHARNDDDQCNCDDNEDYRDLGREAA